MIPTRILLTDYRGALGQALEHEFERESVTLLGGGADAPDWRDSDSVTAYVRHHQPAMIINGFGWSDLHAPGRAAEIRAVADNLAHVCAVYQIPLLHLSSYKVFSGESKNAHSEKDKPAPVSELGQAFLAAEQVLEEHLQKWIGLRLSWVIGSYGNNLLTQQLESIFEQGRISGASTLLRGAPTALSDVARVCVGIVKQVLCGAENWGIMHYCSGDSCTEAEFARQVIQTLEQLQLTEGIVLDVTETTPADEPLSAVLVCRRVRDGFGVQPRVWRTALLPMIRQWAHNREQVSGQDSPA